MIVQTGVISARLREMFGPNVGDWPAARVADEIADMDPACFVGVDLDPDGRGSWVGGEQ